MQDPNGRRGVRRWGRGCFLRVSGVGGEAVAVFHVVLCGLRKFWGQSELVRRVSRSAWRGFVVILICYETNEIRVLGGFVAF